MAFLRQLNRTILVVGLTAILLASLTLRFVAGTITHPLDNLVAGVRALAAGDYTYSITPRGSSESVELAEAFSKMRGELLAIQKKQIDMERVAAVGRAANSISHDLRHYLAALVANAEFLFEADKLRVDRDEVYKEIQTASEQITELLDSLRDLAREHRNISPVSASMDDSVRRAIEAVRARPDLREQTISVRADRAICRESSIRRKWSAHFSTSLSTHARPRQIAREKSNSIYDPRRKCSRSAFRTTGREFPPPYDTICSIRSSAWESPTERDSDLPS